MSLAVLLSLGQGDVQGFSDDDTAVHFRDCLGGLFWRAEAHKAKSLGPAVLEHDLEMNRKGYSKYFIMAKNLS